MGMQFTWADGRLQEREIDDETRVGGASRNDLILISTQRPTRSRLRRILPPLSESPPLGHPAPAYDNILRASIGTLNLTGFRNLPKSDKYSVTAYLGEAFIRSFHDRVEKSLQELVKMRKVSTGSSKKPRLNTKLKRSCPFDELPQKKKKSKKKRIQFDDPPEKELESEWLCYTGSESNTDASDHEGLHYGLNSKSEKKLTAQGPTKDGSDIMMENMALYFNLLRWTGRMPFVVKTHENLAQFTVHHKSWSYVAFCFTTIIMTLATAIMLYNFVDICFQSQTYLYMKIELLEFDKYKEFALFSMLNLVFTVICSLNMIFESSSVIGHYLSEWNGLCNSLHYNTSFKIKYITIREIILLSVYAALVIIGLIVDRMFVEWNGAMGFISLLLLRQWIPNFRFTTKYVWLRWLGLFIHLYSLITSRLLTNMVILYCRALESMARSYNLKLACAFGKVGKLISNGRAMILRRRLPLNHLFAEHVLITRFSREIGAVFSVLLITLIATKIISMLVSAYYLMLVFHGELSNHQDSKHAAAVNKSLIPVKDFLSLGAAIIILSVSAGFSWLEFWHTLECIRDAGEVIMTGLGYMTRHGLQLCKTSMERRFVLSLQCSFNPKNDYYINSINRQFIFGILTLIFSYSLSLEGFYRQRLPNQQIFACNGEGVCRKASYNPQLPQLGHDIVVPKDWKVQNTNLTISQNFGQRHIVEENVTTTSTTTTTTTTVKTNLKN